MTLRVNRVVSRALADVRSSPVSDRDSDLPGGCYVSISDKAHSATLLISPSLRRLMPFQERARAVDGAGLQFRRLLPGKDRDLGIGRQRGDVDGDLERMRDDVVG
jgi:hypothetical protein